ncbi:hypothetical protein [Streptomyces sp. GSL17-111]|uniref:hypothetical protein n=1 Tax=Streptomyces sp. GSL17-111 TaxID=3121596 RepID=UPI0030F448B5
METGADHIAEHWWRPERGRAATGYPTDLTAHSFIATQGDRTPDAPACVTTGLPGGGDKVITYRELLSVASTLAARVKDALQ